MKDKEILYLYIVLEIHGGIEYAIVCCTSNGAKVFDTYDEADAYGISNCQAPLIVKIPSTYHR